MQQWVKPDNAAFCPFNNSRISYSFLQLPKLRPTQGSNLTQVRLEKEIKSLEKN